MNVLSLFDGMGCGAIALRELGINVDKYYASEIDKFAIMQTNHNFPGIIHLGSVLDVDVSKLDRIDLLIGGSPCTSFSFAGKRNGMTTTENEEICTLDRYLELKSEGFQFEGQSYLFWEYMRILTDIRKYNPDVKFLLENVEMGNKWERVISEAIGVFGVHINSALVSAQNRRRIYWLGYMRERFFFEENYCIECEHKRKEYEQKREQGLLGKAQREGAESILGEAQKRCVGLQNLRQKLSEDREKRNNKNLFEGVPILAEERKRQEQEQGESGCLQEKVLSREQDPADRIPAPTQKNGCREGANEESRFRFIKEMQKENADTFTKRDGWEYFHKNERLHLYNKHEANMCCVCCGKRLDYRPHNSVITWGDKRDYQPPSVMSKVQFEKTRQDDGRVFDVVKVGVRGQEGLFGETHSDIPQPKDEGILLKDILEEEVDDKYYLSEKGIAGMLKHKENNTNNGNGFGVQFITKDSKKSNCIVQRGYKDCKDNALFVCENRIRRLTPTEASRLQTIPEWYKWIVSETQQYKLLGNGWTVKVIIHILQYLNNN